MHRFAFALPVVLGVASLFLLAFGSTSPELSGSDHF